MIQINYYFFLVGMRPLTESLFLLTIVLMLWLSLLFFRSCNEKLKVLPLLLGISCSLVFFVRQIGAVVYGKVIPDILFRIFLPVYNSLIERLPNINTDYSLKSLNRSFKIYQLFFSSIGHALNKLFILFLIQFIFFQDF